MNGRGPGRLFHLCIRHLPVQAVGDVVADGGGEQERFLLHDADLAAQVGAGDVPQLHAVDGDAASCIVVEPGQQVHQGRLPRARRAQQTHHLAGLHVQRDVLQHPLPLLLVGADPVRAAAPVGGRSFAVAAVLAVGALLDVADRRHAFAAIGGRSGFLVGEADVIEMHLTPEPPLRMDLALLQGLFLLADDLVQTLQGDETRGDFRHQPAKPPDRPDDVDDQAGVRQVHAHRDLAGDGHACAQVEAGQHLQARDDVGHRPEGGMHVGQVRAPQVLLPVLRLEAFRLVILPGEGLHHPDAGQIFLEPARDRRVLGLVGLVHLLHAAEEVQGGRDDERDHNHRVQGQLHVQQQQGDEVHQEEQRDAPDADELPCEEPANRVHVRRGPLQQFTGLHAVVVGEAQPLQVIVEIVAQAEHDALRGLRGQPPCEEGEEPLGQGQADETSRHPRNHGHAALHGQHVVHEVAQQVVDSCSGQRGQPSGDDGHEIDQPEPRHDAPKAHGLVRRHRFFQIVFLHQAYAVHCASVLCVRGLKKTL